MLQAPKGGSERVDDATRLSKEIASDVPVRINDTEGSGKASLFPVLSILFLRKKKPNGGWLFFILFRGQDVKWIPSPVSRA
jgi:hypothetical protein